MGHYLKNVFWLKGLDGYGKEQFFPITFGSNLDRMHILKNDSTFLFLNNSTEEIKQKIIECAKNGSCEFFAPYGIFFYEKTKLYYAPTLYKTAVMNYKFKFLPKESNFFLNKETGEFYSDWFESFCNNFELSTRKVLSYNKAFKNSTTIVELNASEKRLDGVIKTLNELNSPHQFQEIIEK